MLITRVTANNGRLSHHIGASQDIVWVLIVSHVPVIGGQSCLVALPEANIWDIHAFDWHLAVELGNVCPITQNWLSVLIIWELFIQSLEHSRCIRCFWHSCKLVLMLLYVVASARGKWSFLRASTLLNNIILVTSIVLKSTLSLPVLSNIRLFWALHAHEPILAWASSIFVLLIILLLLAELLQVWKD